MKNKGRGNAPFFYGVVVEQPKRPGGAGVGVGKGDGAQFALSKFRDIEGGGVG